MSGDDHPDTGSPAGRRTVWWTNRLIIAFVVLVSLAVGWVFAVAFLPRWWALRVGQVSDGSFTAGIFFGLTCGIVFIALPLALIRPVFRRRTAWIPRIAFLALAALTAVPNLTTLGIVLGNSEAVLDARRTMDVAAPGFRAATGVGAVLGAVGLLTLWGLLLGRRRRRRELADLRAELRRREAVDTEAADTEAADTEAADDREDGGGPSPPR